MGNRAARRLAAKISGHQIRGVSRQVVPAASQSRQPPAADNFGLLNQFDGFAGLRNGLRKVADLESVWAGIPMPLEGRRLVIEPKFPRAKELSECGISHAQRTQEEQDAARYSEEFSGVSIRNRFWSFFRKCWVVTYQDKDGKVRHLLDRGTHPVARMIDTLDCSYAWGIEQESNAVQTLAKLLRHHHFKAYLLTGMFMEKSKRTGLVYLFRRLRPTLVLDLKQTGTAIRCALCFHPIAFYENTWAGAMTPTDDIIAHLMLMRADEPMLWRRANQHPAWAPEAGI